MSKYGHDEAMRDIAYTKCHCGSLTFCADDDECDGASDRLNVYIESLEAVAIEAREILITLEPSRSAMSDGTFEYRIETNDGWAHNLTPLVEAVNNLDSADSSQD